MIGAALRRAAVAAQKHSISSQSRSMSSGAVDIATEIKELKKWKVRTPKYLTTSSSSSNLAEC